MLTLTLLLLVTVAAFRVTHAKPKYRDKNDYWKILHFENDDMFLKEATFSAYFVVETLRVYPIQDVMHGVT